MRHFLISGAVLPLVLCCAPALAQEAPAAPADAGSPAAAPPLDPPPAVPAAPAECCLVPAGSYVQLELTDLLSSKQRKRGDRFPIRLAEPFKVDGKVVLPAGLRGEGEVIHVATSNIGGKPGELILAARYLDYGATRIPLKGMKLGRAGQDNSTALMVAGMVVSPLLMFLPGGEVQIAPGTRANAKVAADLTFPALPETPAAAIAEAPADPAIQAAPATTDTTQKEPTQ